MTKTIKKVGIPTQLLRQATATENGLKVITGLLNGVKVDLIQDVKYKFIFNDMSPVEKMGCVIHYRNEIIFDSKENFNNSIDLWVDNKSLVKRIKNNEVLEVEIDNYIINLYSGAVESKFEYMFISNENDFTLE